MITLHNVIPGVCIRGCESRENRNGGKYLLVHFEDEEGSPCQLVDKELSHANLYKKDTKADLRLSIQIGSNYDSIRISDVDVKT